LGGVKVTVILPFALSGPHPRSFSLRRNLSATPANSTALHRTELGETCPNQPKLASLIIFLAFSVILFTLVAQ
jgi:hypothetical protein